MIANDKIVRSALLGGIALTALVTSSTAFAQAAAAPTADPTQAASPNDTNDADSQGNEIIVTTRRISERLQDVPVVVNVLGAQDIERQRIDGLTDVARKTPGFKFEQFTGALQQPTIRGQTNLRTTSPVQNVSTNVNGIYLQRNYMVDQGLLDIERIEIIKGPQSALYGRNAFAGVISLITRGPDLDQIGGRVSGTVGTDKRYDAKASLNIPVIPGVLAVYGAIAYSKFDGTWRNNHPLAYAGGTTNGKLGGWDNRAYQLGAKLKIGELITLEGMYIRTERNVESVPSYTLSTSGLTYAFNSLNASPTGVGAARQNRLFVGQLPTTTSAQPASANFPAETRLPGLVVDPRTWGLIGPTEVYIGKAMLDNGGPITVQYTYGHTQANITVRGSSARDPLVPTVVFGANYGTVFDSSGSGSVFKSDSHEVKATFNFGGTITGFIGGNLSHTYDIDSNASEFAAVNSLVQPDPGILFPVAPGIAVFPTTATPPFTPYPPAFTRNTYFLRVENVASAFAFVDWKPIPKISITLEGRFTQEDQRGSDLIARDIGSATPTNVAAITPAVFRKATFFTPRGSLTYKFDDNHNIYASVARGYKSGGINGNAANFNRTTVIATPGAANQTFIDPVLVGQPIPNARTVPTGSTATVTFAQLTPGTAGLSQIQQLYAPETNITYEIGSKNRFGGLTLNLSAFYVDWKNIQSNAVRLQPDGTAPTNFAAIVPSLIGNVGNVRVYGFEIDASYKLTREFRIDFGMSYSHSRYRSGTYSQRFGASGNCDGVVCSYTTVPGIAFPVLDIAGKQLERTPETDGFVALNFDTEFSNGWKFFARADGTYQTKQFADEANLAYLPSRALFNASMGVSIGKLNLQVWGKNIFDKQYASSSLFLIGTGGGGSASYVPILGERATAGVTASYSF